MDFEHFKSLPVKTSRQKALKNELRDCYNHVPCTFCVDREFSFLAAVDILSKPLEMNWQEYFTMFDSFTTTEKRWIAFTKHKMQRYCIWSLSRKWMCNISKIFQRYPFLNIFFVHFKYETRHGTNQVDLIVWTKVCSGLCTIIAENSYWSLWYSQKLTAYFMQSYHLAHDNSNKIATSRITKLALWVWS